MSEIVTDHNRRRCNVTQTNEDPGQAPHPGGGAGDALGLYARIERTAIEENADLQKAVLKIKALEDQIEAAHNDVDLKAKRLRDTRTSLERAGRGLQILKRSDADPQLEIPRLPAGDCRHRAFTVADAIVVCDACRKPLDEITRYARKLAATAAPAPTPTQTPVSVQSPPALATTASDEPNLTGKLAAAVAANGKERANGRGLVPEDATPAKSGGRPRKTQP